jgi:hypothetical protein
VEVHHSAAEGVFVDQFELEADIIEEGPVATVCAART